MASCINGIDHAMFIVNDLRVSADAFARLGFYVTARSVQKNLGTANRLVVFDNQYLELLAVEEPSNANSFLSDVLLKREGLAGVVLAIDDADEMYRDLETKSVAAKPPFEFSRDVRLVDGCLEASFRVVFIDSESTPAARIAACQHRTPQLIWRQEWQHHANSAYALSSLTIISNRLSEIESSYARIFGAGAIKRERQSVSVAANGTQIRFLTSVAAENEFGASSLPPPQTEDFIACLRLRVHSVARARSVLRASNIPHVEAGPLSVRIPPAFACSTVLEFEEGIPATGTIARRHHHVST